MKTRQTINHKLLGGDIMDKHIFPQRKPNKTMSGEELLTKAVTGKHKVPTAEDRRKAEWEQLLKK